MFKYYDPEQQGPLDGILFSSALLALVSESLSMAASNQEEALTPEALAGASGLIGMVQRCLDDIVNQLKESSDNATP